MLIAHHHRSPLEFYRSWDWPRDFSDSCLAEFLIMSLRYLLQTAVGIAGVSHLYVLDLPSSLINLWIGGSLSLTQPWAMICITVAGYPKYLPSSKTNSMQHYLSFHLYHVVHRIRNASSKSLVLHGFFQISWLSLCCVYAVSSHCSSKLAYLGVPGWYSLWHVILSHLSTRDYPLLQWPSSHFATNGRCLCTGKALSCH